jgi:acetolactate decarboxylase
MKKILIISSILFLWLLSVNSKAQSPAKSNILYQYGIVESFLGGLFRGTLPVSYLKVKGNFGIGAPNLVDGELIMYNGKVYQTRSNGQTTQVPDTAKVPLAFVCFFKADTSFRITGAQSQQDAERQIEDYMSNKNGLYAIRITGVFRHIKTRAFYAVDKEPFPPIATLMANQKVFEFDGFKGTMFGYKVPAYLAGVNIAGYHFHCIANNMNQGGHVLDFVPENAVVEIALIKKVKLDIPNDKAFNNYQFKAVK